MPNKVAVEVIATRIIEIRGKKVMLDRDLATLYGVSTKVLNQAVKRNLKRFPEDFMYMLSWQEAINLRSQFVTSSSRSQFVTLKQGQNIKYLPYVFTEQGVAMLSSVLNSERAIQVNIMIMRAFTKLRELLLTHKDLAIKLEALEKKYAEHDEKIQAIFNAIKQLLEPTAEEPKRRIGFHK
jgi:phage regulator Rha-like protein